MFGILLLASWRYAGSAGLVRDEMAPETARSIDAALFSPRRFTRSAHCFRYSAPFGASGLSCSCNRTMRQHRRSARYAACRPVEGCPTGLNRLNSHRSRGQAPLCAARAAWLQNDTLAERHPACDAVVKVQSGGNGLNVGREFRSRRTGVYLYRRGLRPPLFPWPIFGCRAIGEVCRFTSLREACRAPAWRRQFLYARPPPASCGLANQLIDASLPPPNPPPRTGEG